MEASGLEPAQVHAAEYKQYVYDAKGGRHDGLGRPEGLEVSQQKVSLHQALEDQTVQRQKGVP